MIHQIKIIPILLTMLLLACAPVEEVANNVDAIAINSTRTVVENNATHEFTITERAEQVDEKPLRVTDAAKAEHVATRISQMNTATVAPTPAPIDPAATVKAVNSTATTARVQPSTPHLTVTPIPVTQQPTIETQQAEGSVSIPSTMQPFIDSIIDDLVEKRGVERSAVSVVSMEEVVWNDGSLGCPQPGMMYTQALVDGFYIVLEANGEQFAYHTSGTRFFVFCGTPSKTPPTSETNPDA